MKSKPWRDMRLLQDHGPGRYFADLWQWSELYYELQAARVRGSTYLAAEIFNRMVTA
jgi:hypothetical protein